MRVLFVGASSFGLRCLEGAGEIPEISVVGIITSPRTFSISYSKSPVTNVLHTDFNAWAASRSLPCFEIQQGMNDPLLLEWVKSQRPQLFIVVGWYHMLPRSLREIAPAIGLHASLLPDYSGGAPLVWAMINGETETGISLFQLADGVDAGAVYAQAKEAIRPDDTIASLYARIEEGGLQLLRSQLPKIARGEAEPWAQDESKRRVFPQRSPTDGKIAWDHDCGYVDRFIRAQTHPYPGAFTSLDGERFTIWAASPDEYSLAGEPGTVVRSGETYRVCCAKGSIALDAVQYRDQEIAGAELCDLLGDGGQVLGLT